MSEIPAHQPNFANPKIMLVASRALAASRPSLIAFLVAQAAVLSGGIADAISFCNVLFVGNFCASLVVGFWFGFGNILNDFKALKPMVMAGLILNGCLATLLSGLIFTGLQYTTVTNAVLLGRLGPVLFALVGAMLLGKKIRNLEWLGFSLIVVGVITIALKTSNFQVNQGDLYILLSTVVFAATSLVNRLMIAKTATLPVVVFSRNFISSILFFFIAIRLFGPDHFGDAFSGQLWILMAIYSLIVIVFAQFLWYASVNNLDSRTIGRLTVLSPIFGVTYAFLLNGERPSSIQVVTLAIVIVGVLIASLGGQSKKPKTTMDMVMEEPENAASAP
ncbi:DMT family transporter [Leptolyngbyaceae cyanobacterium CCMR0082]|uniref:DMT family transporter n=1 Tax=Adonisia turfae CCMR0082 TaxID=2304604 RepID=A0A6M0SGZ2_9CYAN|nr:DMT family transporter [Adonisia turfae]NEZ67765.1 DMT family transporter [Adonisia turfae CCMR0082]